MNLTSGLTLESDGKPFVHTSRKAERRAFNLSGANSIVVSDVFIKNFDPHIVSDILYIKLVSLVPYRCLACVILYGGLIPLLPVLNDTERVHLAKELGIASKFSFYDREAQFA